MTLRIACDLDGTIADLDGALQREAEKVFGSEVRVRAVDSALPETPDVEADDDGGVKESDTSHETKTLTSRQMRQLWTHVASIENFWISLREIEAGSVARFAALRSQHGMEVIFLTQRPDTAGEATQLQTQRWLEAHGFELPSVYVLQGSRGKAAAALGLDVVLDDRPENCLDVAAESKAQPILVWRNPVDAIPPGAARLGIDIVFSMAEAFRRLEEMGLPAHRSTVLSRLRSAIGL